MYEEFIRKVIFNHKGNNGTALDFGAHKGMYTEILADKFIEYYGFEPDKNNFAHLQQTYKLPNVHFIQKAIGKNDVEEKYYLNEDSAYNSILYSHSKTYDNFDIVQTITIDTFCEDKKISFIKCDVQGAEKFAFEHGINTLKKNKIDICLEVHHGTNHKQLFSLFQSLNYRVYDKKFKLVNIDNLTGAENFFDMYFITNRDVQLHEILDFGSKMISSGNHINLNNYLYSKPKYAGKSENIIKVENFLESETVHRISNEIEKSNGGLELSRMLHSTSEGRVKNKGKSIHGNMLPYRDQILDELMWLNNEHFKFDLSHAQYRYLKYDQDDYFNWHPDCTFAFQPGTNYYPGKNIVHRKLTVIISLTDKTEYEGGELSIINPAYEPENSMKTFQLSKGDLIMFPSFFCHKVNPILSGVRKSLVIWLSGPRLR